MACSPVCLKQDENHLALLRLASGLIAFKKARAATLAAAQSANDVVRNWVITDEA